MVVKSTQLLTSTTAEHVTESVLLFPMELEHAPEETASFLAATLDTWTVTELSLMDVKFTIWETSTTVEGAISVVLPITSVRHAPEGLVPPVLVNLVGLIAMETNKSMDVNAPVLYVDNSFQTIALLYLVFLGEGIVGPGPVLAAEIAVKLF